MYLNHCPNCGCQENVRPPLVLAVDDNEDNLQLLNELLLLNECSVISAADAQTTLVMAQKYQPDLILLDMMLPDLSGIEVVSRLKQDPQTMAIPVIAVTAMAREQDRESFLLAGCNDYIKKPYITDELEAIVRRYLFCKKSL